MGSHMDNARVHLHSGDFNPREKYREKAELRRRAAGCTDSREVKECLREQANQAPLSFCAHAVEPEYLTCSKFRKDTGARWRGPPVPLGAPPHRVYMGGDEGRYRGRAHQTKVFYIGI